MRKARFVLPKCGVCGPLGSACDIEQAVRLIEKHKAEKPQHKRRTGYMPVPYPTLPF